MKIFLDTANVTELREGVAMGLVDGCTNFSAPQALLSAKAGAVYISPFLGRLDDIGAAGMDLVRDICEIFRNYGFKTEVLAEEVRGRLEQVRRHDLGGSQVSAKENVHERSTADSERT